MGLFASKTLLGIEATASEIKLVEGDPSSFPIKVHNFFSVDLLFTDPRNVAEQLQGALKRRKIHSRLAAIAVPGPDIRYQTMDFPPMPAAELKAVMEREIGRLYPSQEGYELRWERLDEVEIGGKKRQRVFVVAAPSVQVSQYRVIVEEAGLTVTAITTVPLALLDSVRLIREWGGKKVCLVHMGGERAYIVFARSGQWSFYREFSLKARKSGAEEGPLERVSMEANVALLYDREHSAGEKVAAIMVSGEGDLVPLQEALEKSQGIPTGLFRLGSGVDFVPAGAKAALFSEAASDFVVPLGLVARSGEEREINLLPREAVRQRLAARRKTMALAAGIVALFLLSAVSLGLSYRVRSYRALVEVKTAEAERLSTFVRLAEEARRQAELQQRIGRLMMGRMPRDTTWTEVLYTLSLVVPEEVLLRSLEMKWNPGAEWDISLKGEAVGRSAFIAQNGFHDLVKALTKSPHFNQVKFMPFALAPFAGEKKGEEGSSGSEDGGGKSKVTFQVDFRLKG